MSLQGRGLLAQQRGEGKELGSVEEEDVFSALRVFLGQFGPLCGGTGTPVLEVCKAGQAGYLAEAMKRIQNWVALGEECVDVITSQP